MTDLTIPPEIEKACAELAKKTSAFSDSEVELFRSQAAQYAERLSWAPAVGNGAAIVAVAGIVGNVPSPDTALSALTLPLAIFSVGLAGGLLSISLSGAVLDLLGSAQAQNDKLNVRLLELVDRTTTLSKGVTPENAKDRATEAQQLAAEADKVVQRRAKLLRRLKWGKLRARAASAFNIAAICSVALGLAVLLIGHSTGRLRLEKTDPATVSQFVPRQATVKLSRTVGSDNKHSSSQPLPKLASQNGRPTPRQ
jgi:hypothetical protein